MPRAGGEADKLGNRYEAVWIVDNLLDVLAGKSETITIEGFGEPARGVEFSKYLADGTCEFHSVKRQKSGGDWTVRELCRPDRKTRRSKLGDLLDKVRQDPTCRTAFVSSTGANRLRNLQEEAGRSTDLANFEERIQAGGNLWDDFSEIVDLAHHDRNLAFQFLFKLQVRLCDEVSLVQRVEEKIGFLIYRPDGSLLEPIEVRLLLANMVLERLGQTLQRSTIWSFLNAHGFYFRDWSVELGIKQRVTHLNAQFEKNATRDLIRGQAIVRAEAKAAAALLLDPKGPKVVLLAGSAGLGKSCVMAQIFSEVSAAGIAGLAFRLDNLEATYVARQLGRGLQLPESPITVLAGLSNGGPAILVVDQLDALSLLSGRNPDLWDAFEDMLGELEAKPNIRLLLACRSFDLEHDQRLRKLFSNESFAKRIDLAPLSMESVKAELQASGVNHDLLGPICLEILRTPIHLFLFLEAEPNKHGAFNGIQDLYNRFWDHKQGKIRLRAHDPELFTKVVDTLVDALSANRQLSVPQDVLDSFGDSQKILLSENVLRLESKRYSFFHETFFDYAFARKLARENRDLLEFLIAGDQHLFRRGQVRQVLNYLRQRDPLPYLATLKKLLVNSKVRFHIKKMVLEWLGQLNDPWTEEWTLLQELEADPVLGRIAYVPLWNSVPWFDRVDTEKGWEAWLKSKKRNQIGRALNLLRLHELSEHRSARIAALICPFMGSNKWWDQWLVGIMSFGHMHHSREMFELFLAMLDAGTFDFVKIPGSSNADWWHLLYEASEKRPDFAAEAVAHWLNRVDFANRRRDRANVTVLSSHSQMAPEVIKRSATGDPGAFARHILPVMLRMIRDTVKCNKDGQWIDPIWGSRRYQSRLLASDAILDSMAEALEDLARRAPDTFNAYISMALTVPYQTIEFLILRAWTANGRHFANPIVEYLLANKMRLEIGYLSLDGYLSQGAVSLQAIQAASPYCSLQNLSNLEEMLLKFIASWERKPQEHGEWALLLLEAIATERQSSRIKSRIGELRRKFPTAVFRKPKYKKLVYSVVSPIPSKHAERMSDVNWLSAMQRYNGTDRHNRRREMDEDNQSRGGRDELAGVLEQHSGKQPARFLGLVAQMGDDLSPIYFDRLLRGVRDQIRKAAQENASAVDAKLVFDAIRRVHRLPNRPCGGEICQMVEALASSPVPDDIITIVEHYAVYDLDPKEDRKRKKPLKRSRQARDLYTEGINTVRGQAAEAVAALMFCDRKRAGRLRLVTEALAVDRSLAVRACTVKILTAWLNVNARFAIKIFLSLSVKGKDILGCPTVEQFLHYTYYRHYYLLRSLLRKMRLSKDMKAAETASVKICLAGFSNALAERDAQSVRAGTVSQRRGAVSVYATNLLDGSVGPRCARYLATFFNDRDEQVRKEAGNCLGNLKNEDFKKHESLINAFIESKAFKDGSWYLMHGLEQSRSSLPEVVLKLAKRATEVIGQDEATGAANMRSLETDTVAKLVFRLYRQSQDEVIQNRCLDLIDQMERLNFYGTRKQLNLLER